MKRILTGTLLGLGAGVLDIIPMIIQKLTWDANLSALSMWTVIGFFLSITEIKLPFVVKGLLVSFLCLLPSVFIIGWKQPASLVPIIVMTTILGTLLGWAVGKFAK